MDQQAFLWCLIIPKQTLSRCLGVQPRSRCVTRWWWMSYFDQDHLIIISRLSLDQLKYLKWCSSRSILYILFIIILNNSIHIQANSNGKQKWSSKIYRRREENLAASCQDYNPHWIKWVGSRPNRVHEVVDPPTWRESRCPGCQVSQEPLCEIERIQAFH